MLYFYFWSPQTPQGTNNGSAANPDPTSRRLQAHIKSQQLKKTLASAGEGGGAILKNGDPTSGGAPVSFITFKDTFFTTIKNTFKTGDDELCLKISTVPVTGGTFKSGLFVKKGSHFKEPFNVKYGNSEFCAFFKYNHYLLTCY